MEIDLPVSVHQYIYMGGVKSLMKKRIFTSKALMMRRMYTTASCMVEVVAV